MSRPRAYTTVLLAIAAWAAEAGAVAAAPGDRECFINQEMELECETDNTGTGQPGTGAVTGTGQSGFPAGIWTRELWGVNISDDLGTSAPVQSPECETDDGEPGLLYRDTLRDPTSGDILFEDVVCVPDDPSPTPAEPAEPPAPPTAEELTDIAPIPELEIVARPSERGLTGHESRFRTPVPDEVEAEATLPDPVDPSRSGWTVRGSLSAIHWAWETGDGGRYETTSSPRIRHTYQQLPERQDDGATTTWPVSVDVTWEGDWSISGYGIEFVVDDLVTTTTATLDYPVIEARGVLHGAQDDG